MRKVVRDLNDLLEAIRTTIKRIEWCDDEVNTINALNDLMIMTDKKYGRIVKHIGGNDLMFIDTNQTSFDLATGEIE